MAPAKALPTATGSVDVTLLDGGGFTTCDDTKIHADGHNNSYYLYDWFFYIHHKPTGQKILWDLGISDDHSLYTPSVVNYHFPSCNPVGPRRSLLSQLAEIGVKPDEIDTVLFSHAHWDHCRPLAMESPKARVRFGPGTAAHCSPGHIQENGEVTPMVQWNSRLFGDSSIQTDAFEELNGPWRPWGPFDKAQDYFADGSFWVIQAPGHMKGNLAACARLPSGEHVLLASDCCHSRDIFIGRKAIANVPLPDGSTFCLHENLSAAWTTIDKLREAVGQYGMHIAMAHDAEFIKEAKERVLISILHPLFDDDCLSRIRDHERP